MIDSEPLNLEELIERADWLEKMSIDQPEATMKCSDVRVLLDSAIALIQAAYE